MDKFELYDKEDGFLTFSREFALLDPLDDKGNYILQEDFWVSWKIKDQYYRIRIPGHDGYHFVTDVASIPRIAWGFAHLTPDGLYRNAAVIHDGGYMYQGHWPVGWFQRAEKGEWVNAPYAWTKDEIDRLFLRIMKACGVNAWKRGVMYWAVRLFGGPAWRRNDPKRETYRDAFSGT